MKRSGMLCDAATGMSLSQPAQKSAAPHLPIARFCDPKRAVFFLRPPPTDSDDGVCQQSPSVGQRHKAGLAWMICLLIHLANVRSALDRLVYSPHSFTVSLSPSFSLLPSFFLSSRNQAKAAVVRVRSLCHSIRTTPLLCSPTSCASQSSGTCHPLLLPPPGKA